MTALSQKVSTGIKGLDSILEGGYRRGSPVLITGGPGSGKSVFGLCFASAGCREGDGAVIVTCDERPERLAGYMDALGMEGTAAVERGTLQILDFRPNLSEEVVGPYELAAIKLRIRQALENTGARRLVIDSLDNLTIAMTETGDLRADIMALFDWVCESGVTALITMPDQSPGETRHRFEEFAADAVIQLSQQLNERLMTRYMRVLKMRGSRHGTNEYPFLLDETGVSVIPVTSTLLNASAPTTRTTTGLGTLDEMVGGSGYLDGSAIIVSGTSGTGKSILSSTLLHAGLVAGKRAVHVSLEESPDEIIRNMRSVGIDLAPFVASGQLEMHSVRSVETGLESHLIRISTVVEKASADLLVLDPISALADLGPPMQVKMMLVRFINRLKSLGVTALFSELLTDKSVDASVMNISSMSDVWIKLRLVETGNLMKRLIHVVKARGSATSNQVREYIITGSGIRIDES